MQGHHKAPEKKLKPRRKNLGHYKAFAGELTASIFAEIANNDEDFCRVLEAKNDRDSIYLQGKIEKLLIEYIDTGD